MKALTVCQPYADLLLLPDSDPRAKRVENRTWASSFRGELLIHAGKSRAWIRPAPGNSRRDSFDFVIDDFVFGAILGVVEVIDWCSRHEVERRHPHLKGHMHLEGPNCVVIRNPRRFETPVPFSGLQKLFDVAPEAVAEQMAAIERTVAS